MLRRTCVRLLIAVTPMVFCSVDPTQTKAAEAGPPPRGANKSGPIEITADGRKVIAVNTDADTVSIFRVGQDGLLARPKEVSVGDEPRSVATLFGSPVAYVANTASGTVSVL